MAINVWELFQPAFRRNRHSFLSVMRKQHILIVARRFKRTTEHLGAEGSTQIMETGHGREDSNRNKLVVTGKLCHYKLTHMVLYCCTGTCTIIMWTFRPRGSVMFLHCTVSSRIIPVRFKVRDDRFIQIIQYMGRNPNRNIEKCLNKEKLLDTVIWCFVGNIGAVDKT